MRYNDGMSNKQKTSFTLSKEARHLLVDLAAATGISQTAMLEVLIRAAAYSRTPEGWAANSSSFSLTYQVASTIPQEKTK